MTQSYDNTTAFITDHFNTDESIKLVALCSTILQVTGGLHYEVGKTEENDPYLQIMDRPDDNGDVTIMASIYRETDHGENPRYVLYTPFEEQPRVNKCLAPVVADALKAVALLQSAADFYRDDDYEVIQEGGIPVLVRGLGSERKENQILNATNERARCA